MNKEFYEALEIEVRRSEEEFRDLANDLEHVKDMNTQMANIYSDVFSSFPKVAELDVILNAFEDINEHLDGASYHEFEKYLKSLSEEEKQKRIYQLKRFRSALMMIEKNDHRIKPKRYEDLDK